MAHQYLLGVMPDTLVPTEFAKTSSSLESSTLLLTFTLTVT